MGLSSSNTKLMDVNVTLTECDVLMMKTPGTRLESIKATRFEAMSEPFNPLNVTDCIVVIFTTSVSGV